MTTRREFFRRAAALPGGVGLAGLLLSSIRRASAIDPAPGSTYLDAEHVVILMQENRSFDHAFGTLRGVRGFNDPRAVMLPDGKPVWLQSNAAGETYAPFRLNIKETKATWLGSLPHSWSDQTDARNHGNHDGWLDAKVSGRRECKSMPFTMGYYNREDLPFYYEFADAFTVCDQHFCSSLTGTTPNRLYLWSGKVRERAGVPACVRNSEADYGSEAHWKTYPERLEEAGVSWKVYQNEISVGTGFIDEEDAWLANFTDNPLEFFEQYHPELAENHRKERERLLATLPGEIEEVKKQGKPRKMVEEKEALLRRMQAEQARWTPEAVAKVSEREWSIHRKAFTTNTGDPHYRELEALHYHDGNTEREMKVPKGDVLHQFRSDVENGKLPSVSWLVAPENFSDHPGAPWYGAWYVAEALNILTRNPEVWKKTIFILTYDENDGYFDHFPPFVAPDPKNPESGKTSEGLSTEADYLSLEEDRSRGKAEHPRGGPIGLGFRVPLVIASPWSRGGYVCSQVFDHTSVLRLLERVKAVKEPNISPWRRTVCGDLSAVFRPFEEQRQEPLAFPGTKEFLEGIHKAQFAPVPTNYRKLSAEDVEAFGHDRYAVGWMAQQEPGVRRSVALLYELHAEGVVSKDGEQFELVLEAKKDGAPFHVYTTGKFRGKAELRTRAYAVAAGGRLADAWAMDGFPGGRYDLHVGGPNGFYRGFAGSAGDPAVQVTCEYEPSGDVRVRLRSDRAQTVRIADNSYGGGTRTLQVMAGRETAVVLPLAKSYHWYDFSVTVEGAEGFLRRFAGRVETGEHGFSDPAMGRVKV